MWVPRTDDPTFVCVTAFPCVYANAREFSKAVFSRSLVSSKHPSKIEDPPRFILATGFLFRLNSLLSRSLSLDPCHSDRVSLFTLAWTLLSISSNCYPCDQNLFMPLYDLIANSLATLELR